MVVADNRLPVERERFSMLALIALQSIMLWYLPPLVASISLVYSASRFEHPPTILKRAALRFCQIMVVMSLLLVLLFWLSSSL